MTPQERAEKIVKMFMGYEKKGDSQSFYDFILIQIEEAQREAITKCNTYHCESCHQDQESGDMYPDECEPGCCCENARRIEQADKKGFSAAREKAVEIAKTVGYCDSDGACGRDEIAAQIEKMEG